MNRKSVSTQILLYFLMLMLLMVTFGCSKSDDTPPATTYSISGTVTGNIQEGVTINLTGAATATTTTAADGTYSFTGRANGTYTVTPVLANYIFDPTGTVVIVNGSSMTADFVATYNISPKYIISGTVSGAVAAGVKITLSGDATGETTTDTDGTYSFTNLVAGEYTVTPYHSGYAFTPDQLDPQLSGGDSTGNDFVSAEANFTQADLEGTWNMHSLETGSWDGWARGTVTIASDGAVTFDECRNSDDITTCPAAGLVFTIDQTTGVITESGTDANPDNHYTMASNKTFIAGTQHSVSTTHPGLIIAQKKVDGTVYAAADLQSKNFAFHGLMVGDNQGWEYATGSTSSTGLVTLSTHVSSSGSSSTGVTDVTFSVDGDGIVTVNTGADIGENFNGFLSADKRTIVGVVTEDSGDYYHLYVIQITNDQVSSTSQLAGTSFLHMLATGGEDFWAHQSMSITSGGVMTFNSDWVTSGSGSGPSGTATMSIGSSGTATLAGSAVPETTFHGQLSYDGKFMVATQTPDTGVYSLNVITK